MQEATLKIHVGRIDFEGKSVWFRSLESEPSEEEMSAWVTKYRGEVRQRGRSNPLIIDVERDRLRGA
jgi:hypothetical protein